MTFNAHFEAKHTPTAKRVRNDKASTYTSRLLSFESNNQTMGAEWYHVNRAGQEMVYMVWSYGPYWPLYVYDPMYNTWVVNKQVTSRTTSNHLRQANPISSILVTKDHTIYETNHAVAYEVFDKGFGSQIKRRILGK